MTKRFTHIEDALLARYLLEEATPEEEQQVAGWLKADPANAEHLKRVELLLETVSLDADSSINAQEALERLHSRMDREASGAGNTRRLIFPRSIIRVAAAVLIVGTVIWFSYPLLYRQVEVATAGNVLEHQLPDGSKVILNRNSSLSYPVRFSDSVRQVTLKGEAFFDVRADKDQPFIIRVNNVTVRVVGTSFNVRNRGSETTVAVESGIVKVSNSNDSIELRAGEQTRSRAAAPLSKEITRGKLYAYYYTGELVCDRTPLRELVEVLNEKFKAQISVEPAIRELPLNAVFRDEPLDQVLFIISESLNIKVERKGQQILMKQP